MAAPASPRPLPRPHDTDGELHTPSTSSFKSVVDTTVVSLNQTHKLTRRDNKRYSCAPSHPFPLSAHLFRCSGQTFQLAIFDRCITRRLHNRLSRRCLADGETSLDKLSSFFSSVRPPPSCPILPPAAFLNSSSIHPCSISRLLPLTLVGI